MPFLTAIAKIWKKMGWQLRTIVILIAFIVIGGLVGLIYYFDVVGGLLNQLNREKEARSTEQQADIDEAANAVNQSANISNQARENTKQIENANFNGTNLSEAERLRCKAFPNSKGCN